MPRPRRSRRPGRPPRPRPRRRPVPDAPAYDEDLDIDRGRARLHRDRPAHQPAPAEAQARLPADPPLRPAARRGQFLRPRSPTSSASTAGPRSASASASASSAGTQLGLYRTSDRTIELHAQQELLREGKSPLGLSLAASIEGLDNFGLTDVPPRRAPPRVLAVDRPRPLAGSSATRGRSTSCRRGSGTRAWWSSAPGGDDSTLVLGLGVRLRITRAMAIVGEIHPRLAGYRGDLGSGNPDALATLRDRVEGRRPLLPAQLLERTRDDTGPGGPRRGPRGRTAGSSASTSHGSSSDRRADPRTEESVQEQGLRPPPVHGGVGARHAERCRDHDLRRPACGGSSYSPSTPSPPPTQPHSARERGQGGGSISATTTATRP